MTTPQNFIVFTAHSLLFLETQSSHPLVSKRSSSAWQARKKKLTAERKGTQLATWLSKGSKDEIPAQERMFTTRNTAPDTNSKLRRRKRMVSQCSPLRQVFVTTSDKLSPQSRGTTGEHRQHELWFLEKTRPFQTVSICKQRSTPVSIRRMEKS